MLPAPSALQSIRVAIFCKKAKKMPPHQASETGFLDKARKLRQSSRWVRSMRSCLSCASKLIVAIGRACRRGKLIGSMVSSQ